MFMILSEVWSSVRFHVSLWTSVSKTFSNYFLGNISLNWKHFLLGSFGLGFLLPCNLSFFSLNGSCVP